MRGPLTCAATNCNAGLHRPFRTSGPNFANFVSPWQGQTANPFVLESSSFTAAADSQFAAVVHR
jgi:hypothetical protein